MLNAYKKIHNHPTTHIIVDVITQTFLGMPKGCLLKPRKLNKRGISFSSSNRRQPLHKVLLDVQPKTVWNLGNKKGRLSIFQSAFLSKC